MKPISFEGQNSEIAKDQDEYQTLPALELDGHVISCWKLSLKERFMIIFTGRIWVNIWTFGKPLQPQAISVEKPFNDNKE